MRHNYTVILLLFIICSACEKKESIDSFDIVTEIVDYDSIYSDKNDLFGSITDFEIVDSILVARHMNDEYYFSFIDVNSGKLVRRFGRQGRGTNEYVQLGSFTISESELVFLDGTKKEINYIPISDLLKKNDTLNPRREPYPYVVDFRPRHLNIVNNKKIIIGSFAEGRFGVLDSVNNIVASQSEYPFNYDEIKGIYRGSVFQVGIKSSNRQSKFVIRTFSSDVFEIYQISDSGIDRIYVSPFNHIPIIRKKRDRYTIDSDKSVAGFMNMAVSEDLICFTYSQQSYDESVRSSQASNEILCFNWNGEKVKKYVLPFPIHEFCIDKHHLYGVRYQNDESIIYRFTL